MLPACDLAESDILFGVIEKPLQFGEGIRVLGLLTIARRDINAIRPDQDRVIDKRQGFADRIASRIDDRGEALGDTNDRLAQLPDYTFHRRHLGDGIVGDLGVLRLRQEPRRAGRILVQPVRV